MPEGEAKATRIGGFEILERLGSGAMGAVFKARQISTGLLVALRILPPELARDQNFAQRFLREARFAVRLKHRNAVQAIGAGLADDRYYFAMEYVEGITVGELIRREGRIQEDKALRIVAEVARALEHAGEHGIVHGHITPNDILVSRQGDAKLADLGLACLADRGDKAAVGGRALAASHYTSPEQPRGGLDIDTRADIYALGATLYHMVTGDVPFHGPTALGVLFKHMVEPAPSPKSTNPELSDPVCDLILHMLAKQREQRPQTPTELLQNVLAILGSATTTPDVVVVGPSEPPAASPAQPEAAAPAKAAEQPRPAASPGRPNAAALSEAVRRSHRGRTRRARGASRFVSWAVTILLIAAVHGGLYCLWRSRSKHRRPAGMTDGVGASAAVEPCHRQQPDHPPGSPAGPRRKRDEEAKLPAPAPAPVLRSGVPALADRAKKKLAEIELQRLNQGARGQEKRQR